MVAIDGKDDVDELRARALQWLAQREHSRQELRDKLLRWIAARQTVVALRGRAAQWAAETATATAAAQPAEHPGPSEFLPPRPATDPPDAGTEADAAPGSAGTVERLLDALEQAGHLSQQRFVESRIRLRAQRHGNRRIEHELRCHGLESTPEARQALAADEYDRARQVWTRKFGALPGTPAERARQLRFMAGRGFTAETVHRVLKEAAHPQAPD